MLKHAERIRPFLGAKDFEVSRSFYRDIGFRERVLSDDLSAFNLDHVWFYLQRYFVQDWIENSMLFLEVDDLDAQRAALLKLELFERYPGVRISEIEDNDWGREFFMHDPSGILWHIGTFTME